MIEIMINNIIEKTYSYIHIYLIILIHILIKESVNTISFLAYNYGNHIVWGFEVRESKDEQ